MQGHLNTHTVGNQERMPDPHLEHMENIVIASETPNINSVYRVALNKPLNRTQLAVATRKTSCGGNLPDD